MNTKSQDHTLARFEQMGYEITFTRIPLGRGALLVGTTGKWTGRPLDLTVNTDGSWHRAWDDEMAA